MPGTLHDEPQARRQECLQVTLLVTLLQAPNETIR
jgi:hypothetical protein